MSDNSKVKLKCKFQRVRVRELNEGDIVVLYHRRHGKLINAYFQKVRVKKTFIHFHKVVIIPTHDDSPITDMDMIVTKLILQFEDG